MLFRVLVVNLYFRGGYGSISVIEGCFFFNDTATTEIYTYGHTLSLHDALPSSDRALLQDTQQLDLQCRRHVADLVEKHGAAMRGAEQTGMIDRKSTRLNSSH